MLPKIENMKSRSGREVANQFLIYTDDKTIFQSFTSTIAVKTWTENGLKVELDEQYWDYSVTTGKYRNIFLKEGIAETRKKIKSGEYKLVNLNK